MKRVLVSLLILLSTASIIEAISPKLKCFLTYKHKYVQNKPSVSGGVRGSFTGCVKKIPAEEMDGFGVFSYETGELFEGIWENNARKNGKLYYKDRIISRRHGESTFVRAIYTGDFRDEESIRSFKNYGDIKFENGDHITAHFEMSRGTHFVKNCKGYVITKKDGRPWYKSCIYQGPINADGTVPAEAKYFDALRPIKFEILK